MRKLPCSVRRHERSYDKKTLREMFKSIFGLRHLKRNENEMLWNRQLRPSRMRGLRHNGRLRSLLNIKKFNRRSTSNRILLKRQSLTTTRR